MREVLAAQPPQPRLFLQLPKLEEGEEIRLLVGEAAVTLVGLGSAFERTRARVLHRECGGDDPHLGEALFGACRDQHAGHARVQRQSCQLFPDRGQVFFFVYGTQLSEQIVAIRNGARVRRIDERKRLDFAEAEALGAQDHRGE
jgi:hypothetical protein